MSQAEVYADTYRDYAPKVRGHLYNNIVDKDEADDIFQDIFFDFWRALIRFEWRARASTLLYTIMKRRIIDYLRDKYRQAESLIPKAPEYELDEDTLLKAWGIGMEPLNMLLALVRDERKKALLLAIKKTRERIENEQ